MEDSILLDILKYILPVKKENKDKTILERIDKLSFLERLVKKAKKSHKQEVKTKVTKEGISLEEMLGIIDIKETKEKEIHYRLNIEKEQDEKKLKDYEIKIKYHENEDKEELSVEIKDKTGKEETKEFSILREKSSEEKGAKKAYEINIEYSGDYKKEHITINYNIPLLSYEEKEDINKQDFSNLAANKQVDIFPESFMGGVLGFTYLGDNYQALRADMLYSPLGKMVDLHEAIHTPDEHETRVLTEWMMDIKKPVYKS